MGGWWAWGFGLFLGGSKEVVFNHLLEGCSELEDFLAICFSSRRNSKLWMYALVEGLRGGEPGSDGSLLAPP